jgi:hypothetical protein
MGSTNKPKDANSSSKFHRRPLEYIAFWQFLAFFLLILLIWIDTLFNLSELFFGLKGGGTNWIGACTLTAVAIIIGFVTVAHTYTQQQRELSGLMHICPYCNKVEVNPDAWKQVELFISERTRAEFSHVICPECRSKAVADLSS